MLLDRQYYDDDAKFFGGWTVDPKFLTQFNKIWVATEHVVWAIGGEICEIR